MELTKELLKKCALLVLPNWTGKDHWNFINNIPEGKKGNPNFINNILQEIKRKMYLWYENIYDPQIKRKNKNEFKCMSDHHCKYPKYNISKSNSVAH